MKRDFRYAFNSLQKIGCPVWTWAYDDENFNISAEDNNPTVWADYWMRDRDDWLFGVNPMVTQILDKYGLHAEWVNPGYLSVYK
jgi:hypothetical protein